MVAKRFFYVCAGVFLLALTYHLGAQNATAQAPGNPVVGVAATTFVNCGFMAVTSSGDTYFTDNCGQSWNLVSNVFGGPTPAARESFGALKSRYRGERGAAQPTQDR